MSLDYDIREVAEEFKADGEPWQITQSLIFATMVVGLNSITEKNVDTFIERIAAYQKVRGALMTHYDGEQLNERPITADEVRARIGLRTNASTMTDAYFRKRMGEILMESIRS